RDKLAFFGSYERFELAADVVGPGFQLRQERKGIALEELVLGESRKMKMGRLLMPSPGLAQGVGLEPFDPPAFRGIGPIEGIGRCTLINRTPASYVGRVPMTDVDELFAYRRWQPFLGGGVEKDCPVELAGRVVVAHVL